MDCLFLLRGGKMDCLIIGLHQEIELVLIGIQILNHLLEKQRMLVMMEDIGLQIYILKRVVIDSVSGNINKMTNIPLINIMYILEIMREKPPAPTSAP